MPRRKHACIGIPEDDGVGTSDEPRGSLHEDALLDRIDVPAPSKRQRRRGQRRRREESLTSSSHPDPSPDHPASISTLGSYILDHLDGTRTSASLDAMTAPSSTSLAPSSTPAHLTPSRPPPQAELPYSDTHLTYTTSTGTKLNLQNAGFVLSSYLQSFNLDPTRFKMQSTFTLIPSPRFPSHPQPLPQSQAHQPPPEALYHCTITLPKPSALGSITSPGIGWRSKDIAKKHAAFAGVRQLMTMGEIDESLTPKNRITGRREKRAIQTGEHFQKRIASLMGRDDPDEVRQKATEFGKSYLARTSPTKPPGVGVDPVFKGIAEYPHIPHAAFWDHLTSMRPNEIWPTLIEVRLKDELAAKSAECRVMCLITARPLPVFTVSTEKIIDMVIPGLGTQEQALGYSIRLVRGRKMRPWEEGQLEKVMAFTNRLIRAQVNKPAEGDLETSKWLVVPMIRGFKIGTDEKVRRKSIAWDEIDRACQEHVWTPFSFDDPDKLEEEAVDAMTTPRYEFARRVYIDRLRRDLKPDSPDPYTGKPIAAMYTLNVELTDHNQPVFEGIEAKGSKHGGFIASLVNPTLQDKFAIPELVHRHVLSASVYKTATFLPSLLEYIDNLLVARDMSEHIFNPPIQVDLALLALTCPTSHGKNHMRSYQRLEMLGDMLLKFIIAVWILYSLPEAPVDWDKLHQDRQVMVSNRTLQARAIEAGIVPFIRAASGKAKEWLPMNWRAIEQHTESENTPTVEDAKGAEGEGTSATRETTPRPGLETADVPTSPTQGNHPDKYMTHTWSTKKPRPDDPQFLRQSLGDKTVADVCESLIGAAYLSSDSQIDGAITAIHTFNIPIEGMTRWSDVTEHTRIQNEKLRAGIENFVSQGGRVAPITALGWEFAVPQHGRNALSMDLDPIRRGRFLQFKILGDAVLDYFMIEGLYNRYPTESPGSLTVMRHSRHGDQTLAAFCVINGLHDYVTDVTVEQHGLVKRFSKAVEGAKRMADSEKDDQAKLEFWSNVPSVHFLADVVNAVFGAILVDSNYNLEILKGIYDSTILSFLNTYCVGPGETSPHPRTVWSEMIYKRGCHHWEIVRPDTHTALLIMHEMVVARAEAETASLAIRRACEEAVKRSKHEGLMDKICTCPKKRRGKDTR